jgi:hypothetical protein
MGGRRKGEIKKEKKWSQKCEKRESGQPKTKRPKKKTTLTPKSPSPHQRVATTKE